MRTPFMKGCVLSCIGATMLTACDSRRETSTSTTFPSHAFVDTVASQTVASNDTTAASYGQVGDSAVTRLADSLSPVYQQFARFLNLAVATHVDHMGDVDSVYTSGTDLGMDEQYNEMRWLAASPSHSLMNRTHTRRALLILLLAIATTVACDQDPFGKTERIVAGPYSLKRWEGGTTFYLDDVDSLHDGGGALGGEVKRLGWNTRWIVGERTGLTGDDGWMVVDVAHRQVSGPFPPELIHQRPELATLTGYRADSAWDKLR